jgi:hypothetical protein
MVLPAPDQDGLPTTVTTIGSPAARGFMRKALIVVLAIGFSLGGTVGAFPYLAPLLARNATIIAPNHPVWVETEWPFPTDLWGKGKAFRCGPSDCGVEVNLYIRTKVGFCNCTTGVSNDDDIDRLGDFYFFSAKPSALGSGHPVRAAWMQGRSRSYQLANSFLDRKSMITIAFTHKCDAGVATAVVDHNDPAAIEPSVVEFLNSRTFMRWAAVALGS